MKVIDSDHDITVIVNDGAESYTMRKRKNLSTLEYIGKTVLETNSDKEKEIVKDKLSDKYVTLDSVTHMVSKVRLCDISGDVDDSGISQELFEEMKGEIKVDSSLSGLNKGKDELLEVIFKHFGDSSDYEFDGRGTCWLEHVSVDGVDSSGYDVEETNESLILSDGSYNYDFKKTSSNFYEEEIAFLNRDNVTLKAGTIKFIEEKHSTLLHTLNRVSTRRPLRLKEITLSKSFYRTTRCCQILLIKK